MLINQWAYRYLLNHNYLLLKKSFVRREHLLIFSVFTDVFLRRNYAWNIFEDFSKDTTSRNTILCQATSYSSSSSAPFYSASVIPPATRQSKAENSESLIESFALTASRLGKPSVQAAGNGSWWCQASMTLLSIPFVHYYLGFPLHFLLPLFSVSLHSYNYLWWFLVRNYSI